MGERLLHQHCLGFIIHDIAGRIDQTILAMGSEGIQGDIGHHSQLGNCLFQGANRSLRQAMRVEGLPGVIGFCRSRGDWKYSNCRDAQGINLFCFPGQEVDAHTFYSWH